jgi:uncharacterized protein (TIGR02646 family)
MKGRRTSLPPLEFLEWLDKETEDWKPGYPINEPAVRDALRRKISLEQRGLCVYCGRKLDLTRPGKSYHVEHFRPQTVYLPLAIDYSNLFLSCGQEENNAPSKTCGTIKGEWFDEQLHVFPVYPECTNRFRFRLDGRVEGRNNDDTAAFMMIEKLNLNHPELVKERETFLFELDGENIAFESLWNTETCTAENLAHVGYQRHGKTLP